MDWVKEEFEPNSDALVIALSSFFGNSLDPNKWEWENGTGIISNITPFKRMFVRDIDEGWYQTQFEGVEGYGPHALASFLKERIKESKAKRVLIMGLSLGGYGALLLGCLCKLDLAIAISPQTFFTPERYKKNKLDEKYKNLNVNKEETDLKVILEKYNNNHTYYNIYYGKHNKLDTLFAMRMAKCNGVSLFPLDSNKHTVIRPMIASGMIKNILLRFIQKGIRA